MKKKIFFAAFLFMTAWSFTSCEALMDSCQYCKSVTRTSSGTEVSSYGLQNYCGADLIAVKAIAPLTDPVTGNITKYECQ
jgi:hypothetical protein